MRETLRLLCPAKINLHLRVGRRRRDGFHPLLTWMTTIGGLFDTLTVEALPRPAGGERLSTSRAARLQHQPPPGSERAGAARILLLSSDLPGLPVDESNLIVRAAQAFAATIAGSGAGDVNKGTAAEPSGDDRRADAKSGSASYQQPASVAVPTSVGVGEGVGDAPGTAGQRPTPGGGEAAWVVPAKAVLEKRIPLGAGLGGGSSDAARTLVGLNRLWKVDWPASRLAEIAETLGSDVPFFLRGPSSVCTGRGEIVQPVSVPRKARWTVLVLPQIHMPTAAVYRRFDELGLGFDDEIGGQLDWEQLAGLSAKELLAGVVNDLETPAFEIRADLGTLRSDIELLLQRPVRMSGSGSSLFTLFDDPHEAESAAGRISARFRARALAVDVAPDVHDDLDAVKAPA
jgi:4-diphosphocytidyl-2C-methyl-D-erythritol kinase